MDFILDGIFESFLFSILKNRTKALMQWLSHLKQPSDQGDEQARGTENYDLHIKIPRRIYFGISICAYFDCAKSTFPRTVTVAAAAVISLLTAKEFLRVKV